MLHTPTVQLCARPAILAEVPLRWVSGALVIALFSAALASCSAPTEVKTEVPVAEVPTTRTLTIVSLNDWHGALYESSSREDQTQALGGLPWLVGALDALRAEDPNLVVLDGGDIFQGSWPINQTEGMGAIEAYRLLGVDASAIGNHDFDYGARYDGEGDPLRGALERAASRASFRWLSANVRFKDGTAWQPEGVAPWMVLERNGVRLGIVGVTTTETPSTTLSAHVADLEFVDPVPVIRDAAIALRAEGVDAVVVIGHLSGACKAKSYLEPAEECVPDGEVGRILTELPEGTVDVLVTGHSHALMANRVGKTFVVQSRAQGHLLGRVDLVFGPAGLDVEASRVRAPWVLIHDRVDPGCEAGEYSLAPRALGGREVAPSKDALELVRRLEQQAGSLCDPIGCTTGVIDKQRHGESALGNLVADAELAAFPGADLAVQNTGGLRAPLPAGPLRREHVQAVMPFDNRLFLVEMSGAQVLTMLRIGASGAHGSLVVAGVSYGYDPARTGGSDLDGDGIVAEWEADRLCGARVAGAPVDPTRTYKLVVTDFLLTGGDDLGVAFKGAPVLVEGPLLREAIWDHVSAQSGCLDPAQLVKAEAPRIVEGSCPSN